MNTGGHKVGVPGTIVRVVAPVVWPFLVIGGLVAMVLFGRFSLVLIELVIVAVFALLRLL